MITFTSHSTLYVAGYRLATRLTIRRSNPCWAEIFCTRPDRPWDTTNFLHNRYRIPFPGVKRPGRGVIRPPPSGTEVKEMLKPYFISHSGPTWPVLGFALPLPLPLCVTILGFISSVLYRSLVHKRCYIEGKSSARGFV